VADAWFVRNRSSTRCTCRWSAPTSPSSSAPRARQAHRPDGPAAAVSPPGYGKTTLMEYVASRLGLVFVKVNGPALGHDVRSLDPAEAPNATARQEVEKINLALRDGQQRDALPRRHPAHDPELLQKFISLCDGQRRIEGVWKGRTRTYDLRGKKFCVVMAGNPYTETGEKFRIPDMLANRADTYNLGDILGGQGRRLRALVPRERPHLERRARAARGARPEGPAQAHPHGGGRGCGPRRAVHELLAGRDRRDHRGAARLFTVQRRAQGEPEYIARPRRRTPTAPSRPSSSRAATAT
jgi:hypothetical protein